MATRIRKEILSAGGEKKEERGKLALHVISLSLYTYFKNLIFYSCKKVKEYGVLGESRTSFGICFCTQRSLQGLDGNMCVKESRLCL